MSLTYWQKLRDPRWQRKRLEIMSRDGFRCQECGSGVATLNVHHKFYRRGVEPWEYENSWLVTLCESCHMAAEDTRDRLFAALVELPGEGLEFATGMCKGYTLEANIEFGTEVQLDSYEECRGAAFTWCGFVSTWLVEQLAARRGKASSKDPDIFYAISGRGSGCMNCEN